MIDTVSAPIRKLAAVGLAAAAVWLVAGGLLIPLVQGILGDSARIEAQREVLGRLTAGLNSAAAMNENGTDVPSDVQRRLFLTGETEAVQLAKLQSLVREAVTAERVRVQSLRTVPTHPIGDLEFAGAQLSFHATMATTQRILHRLEMAEPLLLVKALDITPLSVQAARASGDDDSLRVDVRVAAAMRQRTGSAP